MSSPFPTIFMGLLVLLPSAVLSADVVVPHQRPPVLQEPGINFDVIEEPRLDPEQFFEPKTYKTWADRWHTDRSVADSEAHILFEARGKTELASAYELMKALASSTGNYRVTLLTPGGQWVRREEGGAMKTLILEPGEALARGDEVTYDAALSPRETAALEEAGVHVVFKSIFTNEKCWFEQILRVKEIPKDEIGWDWEGQRYGDDAWADTVLPQWLHEDLPPVDLARGKRVKSYRKDSTHTPTPYVYGAR